MIARLTGRDTSTDSVQLDKLIAAKVQKYDLYRLNQSGNSATSFIGIDSSICYVDRWGAFTPSDSGDSSYQAEVRTGMTLRESWLEQLSRLLNINKGQSRTRSHGAVSAERAFLHNFPRTFTTFWLFPL